MKRLTVRGLDVALLRHLRALARAESVSMSAAAILLMRRGAGLPEPREGQREASRWLDRYVGTMSQQEDEELRESIAFMDAMDLAQRSQENREE
jgi:hypothetical protein